MIRPSLRVRLILAFVAMVSLILFVGVASYVANREVRAEVADLRSGRVLDLRRVDLDEVGLEIEGAWSPTGSFVATDIELSPRLSRPRLRGAIQDVDPAQRTLTLYGVPVHVPEDAESLDAADGAVCFENLERGQRVELTCEVEDGRWKATKVKARDVKPSDKVKGVVTAAELDGEPPETLEIHGLSIVVQPSADDGSKSPLDRIEKATQMILSVQECRASAHELVGRTGLRSPAERDSQADPELRPNEPAGRRLEQAVSEFGQLVEQIDPQRDASQGAAPSQEFLRWVLPLSRQKELLGEHAGRLLALARDDPRSAAAYLDTQLDPFLEGQLVPLVHAFLSQAEEDLGDQLRQVQGRAAATMRIAFATGLVASIAALVLGVLFWKSIHRPLHDLQVAAVRLGQGHLDTRIEVVSKDEIGTLAQSFNWMASQLSTSTVSVENLQSVFDSMAAALLLLDPEARITGVNRAALDLVGYEREDLLSRPLAEICRGASGEPAGPADGSIVRARADGVVAIAERVFVRRDGSECAVAFSGAELRSRDGPLQGYVCVAQDLSEQKRIEAGIRGSLAEKELLLREVHHRVKNNMQVISSLLSMQSSDTRDPGTLDKLEQSRSRIRSMALIHEQLYRSAQLSALDIRSYLQLLTDHLRRSFGAGDAVEVRLRVEDLPLDVDQSLACGLIVTELVTNSLRHAFPAGERGVVSVSLARDATGDCVLSVSDDGRGFGGAEPTRELERPTTMGLSLVKTLARQLRGRVEVGAAKGTEVRVCFPLRSLQGRAAS